VQPFSLDLGGKPAQLRLLTARDSEEHRWHKTVVEYQAAKQPLKIVLTCLFLPEFEMVRLFVTLEAEADLTAHVQNVQLLDLFCAGAAESVDPLLGQYSSLNIPDAVEAVAAAKAAQAPERAWPHRRLRGPKDANRCFQAVESEARREHLPQ
jgi:hypothetical protein